MDCRSVLVQIGPSGFNVGCLFANVLEPPFANGGKSTLVGIPGVSRPARIARELQGAELMASPFAVLQQPAIH